MAKILLVDDDEKIRKVFARALEGAGHEVAVAADGVEALRLFEAAPVDLVVTDLIMPDVEGIELLRTLKAGGTPPKIIAMSGGGKHGAADYLEMATILGASFTLVKPFTPEQLIVAVAKVLAS